MNPDAHSFVVQPQTPRRQIRHRSSLEHILSFTLRTPPPEPDQIAEATLLYHEILADCEAAGVVLRKPPCNGDMAAPQELHGQVKSPATDDVGEIFDNEYYSEDDDQQSQDGSVPLHKLFRAIYDYSPTTDGQVNVVRIILHGLFPVQDHEDPFERALVRILPRARKWRSFTAAEKDSVYRTLVIFASDFLEGFFVPLKAQGRCTPSVSNLITPTSRTEVDPDQGTPTRLGSLRRTIMARDGNRCVVTRKLDRSFLKKQSALYPRRRPKEYGVTTEAAHIIPHSLNALADDSKALHPSKCTVWRMLNMFSPGISTALAGIRIDSPSNAMLLVSELHDRFGNLECYFEAAPAHVGANAYTFHTTPKAIPIDPSLVPTGSYVVFTNHKTGGDVPVDLPSPQLLAIHRACCMMLAMSGAAEYLESLLHDTETLMQRGELAEDGSSNIALVLKLRGLHGKEQQEGELDMGLQALLMAQ